MSLYLQLQYQDPTDLQHFRTSECPFLMVFNLTKTHGGWWCDVHSWDSHPLSFPGLPRKLRASAFFMLRDISREASDKQ